MRFHFRTTGTGRMKTKQLSAEECIKDQDLLLCPGFYHISPQPRRIDPRARLHLAGASWRLKASDVSAGRCFKANSRRIRLVMARGGRDNGITDTSGQVVGREEKTEEGTRKNPQDGEEEANREYSHGGMKS